MLLPLVKKILKENEKLFHSAKRPMKCHGPDHHVRVYDNALLIAKKIHAQYDEELLAAACLLHDVAAYYPDKIGDQYHDFDHKIAKKILLKLHFPKTKLTCVLNAIKNHGSHSKYKRKDEPIEISLLRDADKLDVFGPIGITRMIMARTSRGDDIEGIKDFFNIEYIKKKWKSITFDETRKLAKSDYVYSLNFFKNLTKKLNKVAE